MKSLCLSRCLLGLFCAIGLTFANAALAQKIKVGYWSSGLSLGQGAVMESQKFLEKEGLDVEWVKFSDVNQPLRAVALQTIDLAFAAPSAGAMAVIAEGAPIKIVLNTHIAEVYFVVLDDSPIKSLADIKGKKIGMSPPGSATHSLGTALLEFNHGLKLADYTAVPGTEALLAQFLAQKQIDVAAVRSTTVAQMNELKLRRLGTYSEEWKKLTKSAAPPILAVTIVHNDYLAKNPDAVAKFIAALRKVNEFGSKNKQAVAEVLQKAANMPADDARAYAAEWDNIYMAAFEPADIATLKRQAAIFKSAGSLKQDPVESGFATDAYQRSKKLK